MKKFFILVFIVLVLFMIDYFLIKEFRECLLGDGISLFFDVSKVNWSLVVNLVKSNIKI